MKPEQQELMTIHFTDGFIPESFEVIVFISDSTGKIIADTNCNENKTYKIYPTENMEIPDNFQVTIARYDLYWHNLLIQLNTFTNISQSEWTLKGNQPDTVGKTEITLANIPEGAKAKIFSTSGYYNYTIAVRPQTCLLYQNPDNLYFKINTLDGPQFIWKPNIKASENYELDLTELKPSNIATIAFPNLMGYYEAKLWGFTGDKFISPKSFFTDLVFGDGDPASEVSISYPPSIFDNFRTNIFLREDFQSSNAYNYNFIGEIPTSFELPRADIITVDPAKGMVGLVVQGIYSTAKASWYDMTTNNEIFEWNVFTPGPTEQIKLPEISKKLMEKFPMLSIDSLKFNSLELINFKTIDTYPEAIFSFFDNKDPKVLEQLDYNSIMTIPLYK